MCYVFYTDPASHKRTKRSFARQQLFRDDDDDDDATHAQCVMALCGSSLSSSG